MKKIFLLMSLFILLTACSGEKMPSSLDNEVIDENIAIVYEEDDIDYTKLNTVSINCGPAITLYYDDDNLLVAYDYKNENAELLWDDLLNRGHKIDETIESLVLKAIDEKNISEGNIIVETSKESAYIKSKIEFLREYIENNEYDITVEYGTAIDNYNPEN